MTDERMKEVDRLTRGEFIRLIDTAGGAAVILLEGARALPEEWRPKLVEIAGRLARRFPEARFRSGNAKGSDEAFSWGVNQVDPGRFEYVVPYATHRKANRNPVSYSASIDEVTSDKLREIVEATGEATPVYDRIAKSYEEKSDEMSPRSRASAQLLLRDTMKVLGSEELGLAKPTVGIFFVNEEDPFTGGTGHTMRVCLENDVPVVTQFLWSRWL